MYPVSTVSDYMEKGQRTSGAVIVIIIVIGSQKCIIPVCSVLTHCGSGSEALHARCNAVMTIAVPAESSCTPLGCLGQA